MAKASADLLGGLLKDVSRSFYLTLRVLPGAIRRQIGLAYLLARASDTIADTDAVPREQRLEILEAFRRRIQKGEGPPLQLETLAGHQSSPAERTLLRQLPAALDLLPEFDLPDQERIRAVLDIITSGQALDVERFAAGDAAHIASLETPEQLEDYIYRVAGCVGEFWTRMCRAHLFPNAALDEAQLLSDGVRFGKGLQLVNVLRDLPADLRLGRCYLPAQEMRAIGLVPADLLDPANEPRLRPLYQRQLDRAEAHLQAGWRYTNTLPVSQIRVRLACAWPILIGIQTLGRLRQGNVLNPAERIKISRRDVRQVLWRSVVWYPLPGRWRRLWDGFNRNTLPQSQTLAK